MSFRSALAHLSSGQKKPRAGDQSRSPRIKRPRSTMTHLIQGYQLKAAGESTTASRTLTGPASPGRSLCAPASVLLHCSTIEISDYLE